MFTTFLIFILFQTMYKYLTILFHLLKRIPLCLEVEKGMVNAFSSSVHRFYAFVLFYNLLLCNSVLKLKRMFSLQWTARGRNGATSRHVQPRAAAALSTARANVTSGKASRIRFF